MKRLIKKIQKIHFYIIWDGQKRAKYLKKKKILRGIGENCLFQSRVFPMDPKLLYIHDNVTIAANVTFCTHDAIRHVLNYQYKTTYQMNLGCIEIMDNVFIGIGSIIMPNVRINKNVIVAAGSVVTKDIPENSVVAGVPARVIGTYENLVKNRSIMSKEEEQKSYEKKVEEIWETFNRNHQLENINRKK